MRKPLQTTSTLPYLQLQKDVLSHLLVDLFIDFQSSNAKQKSNNYSEIT